MVILSTTECFIIIILSVHKLFAADNGFRCSSTCTVKEILDQLDVFCQSVNGAVIGSSCFKLVRSNSAQTSWNDQWQMCKDPNLAYSQQFRTRVGHIYSADILDALGEYLLDAAEFPGYVAIGAKKISLLPGKTDETFHWMRNGATPFEKSFSAYNSKIASPDGIVTSDQAHSCVVLNQTINKEWKLNTADCNNLGSTALCEYVAPVQRYVKQPHVRILGQASMALGVWENIHTDWECGKLCSRMDGCVTFKHRRDTGRCKTWGLKFSDKTLQDQIYPGISDNEAIALYDRYF